MIDKVMLDHIATCIAGGIVAGGFAILLTCVRVLSGIVARQRVEGVRQLAKQMVGDARSPRP